jgi:hypothetical protein
VVEVEEVRAEGVAAEEEGAVVEAARAPAGEFCWSVLRWQGRCRCLGIQRLFGLCSVLYGTECPWHVVGCTHGCGFLITAEEVPLRTDRARTPEPPAGPADPALKRIQKGDC